jgi:hypothetical protein
MTESSFIENINKAIDNLEVIKTAGNLNQETISDLKALSEVDIAKIVEDLKKGNYLGNRKIDINLELNNASDTEHVSYKSVNLVLNDGVSLDINFEVTIEGGGTSTLELTSHADIKNYIANHDLYTANVINTELTVEDEIGDTPQMIRFRDADGKASNIDRISLVVFGGSYENSNPTYYWAKTTSALQTLANRVGDVISLGQRIDKIIALADKEDEIQWLYDFRAGLQALYDELSKLNLIHDNLPAINAVNDNKINIDKAVANEANINNAVANEVNITTVSENIEVIQDAKPQAEIAKAKAEEATATVEEIKSLGGTHNSVTTIAGTPVNVTFDPTTGKFTFSIPQGQKGEKGDSFEVNAIGTFANRTLYDDQQEGFSYLATDVVIDGKIQPHIYFKLSDASGDWSDGSPFGKGDAGTSIEDITFSSTSDVSGEAGKAGATDTYNIVLDDGSIHTFLVTNGAIPTKADLGLENVDNTSDANKPVSNATQIELNKKFDKTNLDDDSISETTIWSSTKTTNELDKKMDSTQTIQMAIALG